jgi:hypothetical protein
MPDPGANGGISGLVSPRKRGTAIMASTLRRKVGIVVAVAALCAAAAGCVSDMGAPTAENAGSQMHYYGGPKYPMWSSQ